MAHPSLYEGFGEITFFESHERATGNFWDANLVDLKSTTRKSVVFVRSNESDLQSVRGASKSQMRELIQKKLKEMG